MPDKPGMIPIARTVMDEREVDAARRPIVSGWVTQGPEVEAFEREFAEYVGAAHACAVSNCTTALHLALLAVGVRPGDEVITVSHSFIATANSIRYCGATPLFVDIRPDTFNMDPVLIESAITARTRAILCVHQVGMPCDLDGILKIAKRRNLPVVEDAACAVGSEIRISAAGAPSAGVSDAGRIGGRWDKIGKPHGDVACFSFHPRKVISTGDGGMITTANADLDRLFRLLRQQAMSVPDTVRHGAKEIIFESYPLMGYNYRMTDIQAAVGREQLRRLPEIVSKRREIAERYRKLLAGIPHLGLPDEPAWARSNWQSYCVRLPVGRVSASGAPSAGVSDAGRVSAGRDQRRVMQWMLDRGIATRRGIMCAHREPAYAKEPWRCVDGPGPCGCAPGSCKKLVESERAQDQCILLPLYPQMTESDQDRVVTALSESCKG